MSGAGGSRRPEDDEAAVVAATRPGTAPLVPEVRLRLLDEGPDDGQDGGQDGGRDRLYRLWERDGDLPYWAVPWPGGQLLARLVLDRPALVAGRSVLDVGSGGGLVAVAAALAGAAAVRGADVDPRARAATRLAARANGVEVATTGEDLLDGSGAPADVVLVGDLLYDARVAPRVVAFAERAAARGALVLVGDPERSHRRPRTPGGPPPEADPRLWAPVLTRAVPAPAGVEGAPAVSVTVWELARGGGGPRRQERS